MMKKNFSPNGSQDLHRGEEWRVPDGEVDPKFTGLASFNFGYVTRLIQFPNASSKLGAGQLNNNKHENDQKLLQKKCVKPTLTAPSIWFWDMDPGDRINFNTGARVASAALQKAAVRHVLPHFAPLSMRGRILNPRGGQPHAFNDTPANGLAPRDAAAALLARSHYAAPAPGATTATASAFANTAASRMFNHLVHANSLTAAVAKPSAGGSSAPQARRAPGPTVLQAGVAMLMQDVGRPAERLKGIDALAGFGGGGFPASVAPVGRSNGTSGTAELNAARSALKHAAFAEQRGDATRMSFAAPADDKALSQALSTLLNRQARLPPAGGTGFDPRLSPAWPGLKLPN